VSEIALVADEHDDDVLGGVVAQLLHDQPARNVVVRAALRNVVHQQSAWTPTDTHVDETNRYVSAALTTSVRSSRPRLRFPDTQSIAIRLSSALLSLTNCAAIVAEGSRANRQTGKASNCKRATMARADQMASRAEHALTEIDAGACASLIKLLLSKLNRAQSAAAEAQALICRRLDVVKDVKWDRCKNDLDLCVRVTTEARDIVARAR